jgi:lipoprotein-anchoring transpeptidase ErfK/SrfK
MQDLSGAEPIRANQFMFSFTRRAFIAGMSAISAAGFLVGCTGASTQMAAVVPAYHRKEVKYGSKEAPGTIVVDPAKHYLYLVQAGGKALRYGVGVGREGYAWSGIARVHSKQEWPEWHPTKEYIQSHPGIEPDLTDLLVGQGVVAGPNNPLGARALYLWQGNRDTLYRIHGTNEPSTIGQNVSAGCIRMTNEDVIDLYDRVRVGTKVVVLASSIGSNKDTSQNVDAAIGGSVQN